MAELLTVKGIEDGVEGWQDGASLVKDEATGQHYVVSTVQHPWRDKPETLIYPTDATGSPDSVPGKAEFDASGTDPVWVAGGVNMDHDDALADLSARIDEDKLFTSEGFEERRQEALAGDFEAFMEWMTKSVTASQAG